MNGRLAWLVLSLTVTCAALPAAAAEDGGEFERASHALDKGDLKTAIGELEVLADRGVIHPDVSYNRGLAYARRSRTRAAEAGDLGRAAAGFEEALRLAPDHGDAALALDLVRAEVARRRSRQDKNDTIVRPSLERVLMTQWSPFVWGVSAVVASVLLAVGLLLRSRPSGWAHVAGSVLAPFALLGLVVLTPVAYFSREIAETTRPGVVITPEAALTDLAGANIDAPVMPEATLVELGERRAENVFVRWGSYEGWVAQSAVRPLLVE